MEKGQRVRITALGPKDSYNRDGDNYNLVGQTGTLLSYIVDPICTPGYITCMIELDKPLLNYLVRITLYEAILEPIEGYDRRKEDKDGKGISPCESTEV